MPIATVDQYHERQADADRLVLDALRYEISGCLRDADGKIWHAHPVWFLDGNPIVGYSKLKDGVRLLFWSGQSFSTPGLAPQGKFKSAEKRYSSISDIDRDVLRRWLLEARSIQWDYKNIVKNRGRLERIS